MTHTGPLNVHFVLTGLALLAPAIVPAPAFERAFGHDASDVRERLRAQPAAPGDDLALTASRSLPFLKYALGRGHACVRLRVADRYLDSLIPAGAAV